MALVEIRAERLSDAALDGIIEEFVTREGTEYGARDYSLAEKKVAVQQQLARGDILIVFDPESERCTLVSRRDFRA